MSDLSQASPSSSPSTHPPNWLSHGHGRILYPVLTVLNVVLILFLYYYISRILCRKSERSNETTATAPLSTASSPSASMHNARLNPDVLSSLPVFMYSMANDGKLDCSVCLAELKDGEKGRLLPRCSHSFHADCVDMWFQSHSTCPICRSAIEPKVPGSDETLIQKLTLDRNELFAIKEPYLIWRLSDGSLLFAKATQKVSRRMLDFIKINEQASGQRLDIKKSKDFSGSIITPQ